MSEFEEFARSQGFSGDFKRGCNGQYKSDLLHFMEKAFMHQQAKIDELQKKYDAMYNAFTVADDCRKEWHRCYVGVRQREDELQGRIDKALIQVNNHKHSCEARKKIKHMIASVSEISEIEAHESNMCVLENILEGK